MRIALVHTNLRRGGGMEAYLLSLINGFQRQGDEVTVYACQVDWQLARELGCSVQRIHPPWPRKLREFRFLHQCNQLPLRHEYDFSLGTARTSCPHVTVCGGVHVETIRHIRRTALFRGFYDMLEKGYEQKAFEGAPHIMAHSKAIANQIQTHYQIAPQKITVLYPPIDTERFRPLDRAERSKTRLQLGLSDDKLALLFVSCGHQRKGLAQLCKAFEQLDPHRYELLVAGSALKGSHPPNVRYLGYINELASVYAAVDYTILPSFYEPFGLVVPESIQCGTPVIVTRDVGAAELLTPREAIVLADNSSSTLVAALRQLDRTIEIESDFAQRHQLSVEQHIQAIKHAFC